jgi:hypothetical protein
MLMGFVFLGVVSRPIASDHSILSLYSVIKGRVASDGTLISALNLSFFFRVGNNFTIM